MRWVHAVEQRAELGHEHRHRAVAQEPAVRRARARRRAEGWAAGVQGLEAGQQKDTDAWGACV